MIRTKDKSDKIIHTVGYTFISLFALCCLIPFILIISASFSQEREIVTKGFSLLPRGFTLDAYTTLFQRVDIMIGSFFLTVGLTVVGTGIGLFIIAMTGYALQRPDFRYRNVISFYIYFTSLFSAGVVPFYMLMTQYYHLNDSYLAILLPSLMTPWYVILMKSFMKSIPHSITESAKMDGAGDFRIFLKLILPLSKPSLATVGLFLAIGYWNEYYNSMLFLSPNTKYKPMQLFLYNAINKQVFIRNASSNIMVDSAQGVPLETMKMAIAVVSIVPIICVYPFIQKYFITGLTVGSVKG